MLADIAQEIEQADVLGPVPVVHQHGRWISAVKVQEAAQLGLHRFDVGPHLIDVHQVALDGPTPGVADHAGGATGEDDGSVAVVLEATQQEQRDQVAHVQRGRRRIESGVQRDRALGQSGPQRLEVGVVLDEAPGGQIIEHGVRHGRHCARPRPVPANRGRLTGRP